MAKITIIDRLEHVPYHPVHYYITQNAYRHMRRAGMHAANGEFEYADGSAEKATKNFKAYFEFVEFWNKYPEIE